jgi:hypothetical protein
MTQENSLLDHIRAVKDRYERELMRKKNVLGVGIGLRKKGGVLTDETVLTVMVRHKEPRSVLRPTDVIPTELDGVPVDVQKVGTLRAL